MMKNKLILLFALGLCAQVQAQVPHLSRETYRERVEAYSQVLETATSEIDGKHGRTENSLYGISAQSGHLCRRNTEPERDGFMGRTGRTIS